MPSKPALSTPPQHNALAVKAEPEKVHFVRVAYATLPLVDLEPHERVHPAVQKWVRQRLSKSVMFSMR
jgi:hypothetical protein